MDAAQALADLTEISSQIEGAVLAKADGSVVASTFREQRQGADLAEAAVELVGAAREARGDAAAQDLVQLEAATPRGSVFVVRDDRHVVAAVTRAKPTVGLVFYDLKSCLRSVAGADDAKPKRRTRKKTEESSAAS